MTRIVMLVVVALGGLSRVRPILAQEGVGAPVLVGERVRVRSCERTRVFVSGGTVCRNVTGTLIAVTPERLTIRATPDSVAVLPRAGLAHVQRSAGVRRRTGRGAVIGGAIGLGLGLAAAAAVASDCQDDPGCAWVALGAPFVTTAAGVGIGAGIGAITRSEAWVTLSPEVLTLTLMRTPGGASLALRLRR